jgi:mRNA-degrading endonuclease RelE of RelBE toxin-antitoxin system
MNIAWSARSRADVRAIDRQTAMQILDAIARFARIGDGDVKALTGPLQGLLRLRAGDYRVFFLQSADSLHIARVLHRRDAYR